MTEVWRDAPGYTGYQVSSAGRVRSVTRVVVRANGRPHSVQGRVLAKCLNPKGYPVACILRKPRLVHRMVAEAFYGAAPAGCTDVNHKDGVKSNNSVDNPEWCTRSENVLHAIRYLGSKSGASRGRLSPARCDQIRVRNSKKFEVMDPVGNTLSGIDFSKFCRSRGLPYGTLLNLHSGVIKSSRLTSWRLVSLKPKEQQK